MPNGLPHPKRRRKKAVEHKKWSTAVCGISQTVGKFGRRFKDGARDAAGALCGLKSRRHLIIARQVLVRARRDDASRREGGFDPTGLHKPHRTPTSANS
jgi:hypothetical protein